MCHKFKMSSKSGNILQEPKLNMWKWRWIKKYNQNPTNTNWNENYQGRNYFWWKEMLVIHIFTVQLYYFLYTTHLAFIPCQSALLGGGDFLSPYLKCKLLEGKDLLSPQDLCAQWVLLFLLLMVLAHSEPKSNLTKPLLTSMPSSLWGHWHQHYGAFISGYLSSGRGTGRVSCSLLTQNSPRVTFARLPNGNRMEYGYYDVCMRWKAWLQRNMEWI